MDDFAINYALSMWLNGPTGYFAERKLSDGRLAVVSAGVTLNAQLHIANSGVVDQGFDAVF
jgi:hypothetical protein